MRPKKKAKSDRPVRVGPPATPSKGRSVDTVVDAILASSTHSYVASTVSETLGILVEDISSEMTIVSPLGQSIQVSKLYRDFSLEVQGTVFRADLMELPFGEFDLILRMDWLVKHRRKSWFKNSVRHSWPMLVFLILETLTVRNFPHVFPEKLLGLPSSRDVEFGIELFSGIAPVSIVPY
ncbi:uncharacterized protein LOC108451707 [Gossypium arboreum]|uniref:uncharacterized protein LOC108451707 n=1 Tax=Gossypium arboreum TaxID=29729 RepID=UPI000818FB85|nr:uncharacterized protein LOC108451707 [Gossypium arboreum]